MKYLNALNKINGIGPQKIKTLVNFFGVAENIWKADFADIVKSGLSEKLAELIITERKNINPDQEWQKIEDENITVLSFDDPNYPQLLKEIPTHPYLLYIRGEMDFNSQPMVSIVGSRKYTSYGERAANFFARGLAESGITVVSGMAIGIDSIAHRGALEASGKTVAVLGNSLDEKNIYPINNFNLSREISASGALVSDYPIETPANNFTFPARNRIIAGMSLGTLVIEAGEKSGTLITSELALEFNREVFAVPGMIFSPQSSGTNSLIRRGAKVVTNVQDILDELDLQSDRKTFSIEKIPENKEEELLLKILSGSPMHIDNISKLSKLGTATASSMLSLMEMKGWVKNIGGQNYIIL